jgi:hypothetical protein
MESPSLQSSVITQNGIAARVQHTLVIICSCTCALADRKASSKYVCLVVTERVESFVPLKLWIIRNNPANSSTNPKTWVTTKSGRWIQRLKRATANTRGVSKGLASPIKLVDGSLTQFLQTPGVSCQRISIPLTPPSPSCSSRPFRCQRELRSNIDKRPIYLVLLSYPGIHFENRGSSCSNRIIETHQTFFPKLDSQSCDRPCFATYPGLLVVAATRWILLP